MKIMMIALLAAGLAAAPAVHAKSDQADGARQDDPRGQAVSGCNHQANELGVRGKERKDFVDRCVAQGGNDRRAADMRRSCAERATRQGMRGEAREEFMSRCRGYRTDERDEAGFSKRLRECTSAAKQAGRTREQRRQHVEGCMDQPAAPAKALPKDAERRDSDRSVRDEERNRGKRRPDDDGTVKNKD